MVVVNIKNPETKEEVSCYYNGFLKQRLDKKVLPALRKRDEDYVMVIDGGEGSGKSTLAMQICKYIDPTFNVDRICFNPHQFRECVVNAKKYQAILYDEAFRGLSSRGALSEVNRMLVTMMQEMRQLNLLVIICIPTFHLLDKYAALWRAKILLHVYKKGNRKGLFVSFNRKQKQYIYLHGKKDYSYYLPKYLNNTFRGDFTGKYIVDEQKYRKMKDRALKDSSLGENTRDVRRKKKDNALELLANRIKEVTGESDREISKWLGVSKTTYLDYAGRLRNGGGF